MNLLAIDTSGSACSIALLYQGRVTSFHEFVPMQQTRLLLPNIDLLLKNENISINQLDAIAIGCGPGSFTGIRVGISVVQALAYANNLPVIAVSSLHALAQTIYLKHQWQHILVAVDARINEIYACAYTVNERGLTIPTTSEQLIRPENLGISEKQEGNWYGAGNAWDIYKNLISFQPITTDPDVLPDARAILRLAQEKFGANEMLTALALEPVYLRDKVAVKEKKS